MGEPNSIVHSAPLSRILRAALEIAQVEGFSAISRSKVADIAEVSRGTVSNAFGSMPALCDAVMREAVDKSLLKIVAQGLAAGHPIAMAAPAWLKKQAAAYLTA